MLVKLAFVIERLKNIFKKFLPWSTKMGGGGQFLGFKEDTAVIRADIELMGGPSQSATVGKILLTSFYKKLVWISHSRSGFLYARTDYCSSTSLWMLTDFTCFLGLWMISTLFVLACRHNKTQMHTLHAWQKAIELFTKFIIHFLTYRAECLFSPEFYCLLYLFYRSLSDWVEYELLGHRSMCIGYTDRWPRIEDGSVIDWSSDVNSVN